MPSKSFLAFHPKGITLAIDGILPTKSLPKEVHTTSRYKRVKASIKEVGIIEPPIVFPQDEQGGVYMLLDGHLRLHIAKQFGQQTIFCLIATDDEGFTYNHKVSQLTPMQEHFMIQRAIKNGVSEDRLAIALNIKKDTLRKKRNLLAGICPEAITILRTRNVPGGTLDAMRKVQPMRQIEMAELMLASHNFSVIYAKCLVTATPENQLAESHKPKNPNSITPNDLAILQSEMQNLEREFILI